MKPVSVMVITAVMKQHDQRNLGKKWLILLLIIYNSSLLKEVLAGIETGQKFGGSS